MDLQVSFPNFPSTTSSGNANVSYNPLNISKIVVYSLLLQVVEGLFWNTKKEVPKEIPWYSRSPYENYQRYMGNYNDKVIEEKHWYDDRMIVVGGAIAALATGLVVIYLIYKNCVAERSEEIDVSGNKVEEVENEVESNIDEVKLLDEKSYDEALQNIHEFGTDNSKIFDFVRGLGEEGTLLQNYIKWEKNLGGKEAIQKERLTFVFDVISQKQFKYLSQFDFFFEVAEFLYLSNEFVNLLTSKDIKNIFKEAENKKNFIKANSFFDYTLKGFCLQSLEKMEEEALTKFFESLDKRGIEDYFSVELIMLEPDQPTKEKEESLIKQREYSEFFRFQENPNQKKRIDRIKIMLNKMTDEQLNDCENNPAFWEVIFVNFRMYGFDKIFDKIDLIFMDEKRLKFFTRTLGNGRLLSNYFLWEKSLGGKENKQKERLKKIYCQFTKQQINYAAFGNFFHVAEFISLPNKFVVKVTSKEVRTHFKEVLANNRAIKSAGQFFEHALKDLCIQSFELMDENKLVSFDEEDLKMFFDLEAIPLANDKQPETRGKRIELMVNKMSLLQMQWCGENVTFWKVITDNSNVAFAARGIAVREDRSSFVENLEITDLILPFLTKFIQGIPTDGDGKEKFQLKGLIETIQKAMDGKLTQEHKKSFEYAAYQKKKSL